MKRSRLPVYYCLSHRAASTASEGQSNAKYVNKAQSGKNNFEKDFERSHIKTNIFQKALLGLGSGVVSITSPSRGDMIAVLGEVTGYQALHYMRSKMTESEEGRRILEEKPRISSGSIDLEKLEHYPEGTLGKAYINFLDKYGYTPDTRNAVQFVDDIELAYVAQRYRETHDLIHTLLDMPTNMLGEVTVKWVEAIQFKLPMCATGALFGAMRLAPKFTRAYSTKPIIKLSSSLVEVIESQKLSPRKHPGVTHLARLSLPDEITKTILQILKDHRKHLKEDAEHLERYLWNRVLPVEALDKKMKFKEFCEFYSRKYPEDFEWTEKELEEVRRKALRKLRTIINNWKPLKFDKKTSLTYLMARAPLEYAVVKRVFHEIRANDGDFAPKSLLDFGSGIGSVNWVAHELWGNSLEEYYCVDASDDMNELASLILKGNNVNSEPFIRTVYYRQFFPATPRLFDIVVSSFTLFELPNREQRFRMITALWNDTKEYLVLIENGTNWGFQVIYEAREYLLGVSEEYDVDCYVFAPCPHEFPCPRAFADEKKEPCNFFIHYKVLSFSSTSDTSNTAKFSYVIFRKRPKPPDSERRCRLVREVLKRHRHVVCKLCTTEGKLNTLFVTASKHGKAAYKCMKASHWGDMLPGPLEMKLLKAPDERLPDSYSGEIISEPEDESEDGPESGSECSSCDNNNKNKNKNNKNNNNNNNNDSCSNVTEKQ